MYIPHMIVNIDFETNFLCVCVRVCNIYESLTSKGMQGCVNIIVSDKNSFQIKSASCSFVSPASRLVPGTEQATDAHT